MMRSLKTTLILSAIAACLFLARSLALSQQLLPAPTKVGPQKTDLPQTGGKTTPSGAKLEPKLVPVAETRLLMEGLAHANFRGLERLLKKPPTEDQTWTFARGQALLIAETGNLLMLRPPKNQGEPVWFARAMELRTAATQLAETLSKRDYEAARTGLIQLAGQCNRCHKNFRVKAEIAAFDDKTPVP